MKGYEYKLIVNDEDTGFVKLCDECEKELNKKENIYLDPWEPTTGCDCNNCGCCI